MAQLVVVRLVRLGEAHLGMLVDKRPDIGGIYVVYRQLETGAFFRPDAGHFISNGQVDGQCNPPLASL
jgi:hypothetical protein